MTALLDDDKSQSTRIHSMIQVTGEKVDVERTTNAKYFNEKFEERMESLSAEKGWGRKHGAARREAQASLRAILSQNHVAAERVVEQIRWFAGLLERMTKEGSDEPMQFAPSHRASDAPVRSVGETELHCTYDCLELERHPEAQKPAHFVSLPDVVGWIDATCSHLNTNILDPDNPFGSIRSEHTPNPVASKRGTTVGAAAGMEGSQADTLSKRSVSFLVEEAAFNDDTRNREAEQPSCACDTYSVERTAKVQCEDWLLGDLIRRSSYRSYIDKIRATALCHYPTGSSKTTPLPPYLEGFLDGLDETADASKRKVVY
eukprot:GHVS01027411.1.p1 GENE.GHVS01027411.1~~GHVS01027411.1.p1  ORF type:complete len:317 (-),score=28.82 GHVS01027411.1:469-1419(-)